MTKLIWMSDLHFIHDGLVQGHDPRARLNASVDFINAHHSDAVFCVISGDMVDRGAQADYAAVAKILSRLAVPVFPMVGNHDDQALLRANLPLPDGCMEDFIQYSLSIEGGTILCLDTQKAGSDAGEFCGARRDWLVDQLRAAGDQPVYLFMHHPPMPLGLPMQDTDRMEDGAGFLDVLCRAGNVAYMFIGHVHRPISGTMRGIPFSTMRSVLYQAPAPVPAWDWSSFRPGQEAPNIGVMTFSDQDVALQYIQFCDHGLGTNPV